MRKNVTHAIISAAGLGSRLGLNTPKCLVKIWEKEMIYYILRLLDEIDDVRVVVGFKEMDVIEVVKQLRKDVTYIRNPDYATTSNAYSLHLATRHLKEPFVTIDGDMLINPDSFIRFLDECKYGSNLIGVTKTKSEDAVFVEMNDEHEITKFQRITPMAYEWCGIAYFGDIKVHKDTRYVFNEIEQHLPVKAFEIDCYEVDTPQDMNLVQTDCDYLRKMYE